MVTDKNASLLIHCFAKIITMQYDIYKDSVIPAPVHFDVPMQLLRRDHV